MFSWYKYLIVGFFSHLGFWSGSLFLIAPFPDLCLLVLFYSRFDFLNILSFVIIAFVFIDVKRPTQQTFSDVGTEPPLLCSRTQHGVPSGAMIKFMQILDSQTVIIDNCVSP